MKKIHYVILVLMGLLGNAHAELNLSEFSIVSRLAAPLQTFKEPIRPLVGSSVAAGYARTFQKSGSRNRAIGVLPIADWGVLELDFLTATGDFSNMKDDRGMIGGGGSVQANKVLASMFPEIAHIFVGDIPGTSRKLQYEMNFGAGFGWDFSYEEAVSLLYFAPKVNF